MEHAHGTTARYRQGCKCFACRKAWSDYIAERKSREDIGYVDCGPALRHVERLRRDGYSIAAIAASAGVSQQAIYYLQRPGRRVLQRATSEAILAATGQVANGRVWIDARPTHRRVSLLRKKGLRCVDVARLTGLGPRTVQALARGAYPRVQARIAGAIERVAVELGVERHYGGAARLTLQAKALDAHLEALGYDLEAVLDAAGIAQDGYTKLRAGRPCSEAIAEKLARAAGMRMDALFAPVEAEECAA